MKKFMIDDHKELEPINKEVAEKRQQLIQLQKELEQVLQNIPELETKLTLARADVELSEGSGQAVDDAESALEDARNKQESLQADIAVKKEVINRLGSKYEEKRAEIVSSMEDEAKQLHEKAVQKAVMDFNTFADSVEELEEFERSLPNELNVGQMGLTRGRMHRRRDNRLPQWMDKAEKLGYSVY